MAETTTIEWTEATWQIVTGCSIATPGCTNCYAMRLAGSRLQHHPSRVGLTRDTKAGPVWTGEVRFNEQWLTQPLLWKRPRKIFVAAHGDLFHEAVPDEWIDRVFAVMALCPQHMFQVLTKRADRMRRYLDGCLPPPHDLPLGQAWVTQWHRAPGVRRAIRELGDAGYDERLGKVTKLPLPNVWLGVSVEDQRRADERIPDLLATPAAVRWISAEPLLGPVDLERIAREPDAKDRAMPGFDSCTSFWTDALDGSDGVSVGDMHYQSSRASQNRLNWVVVGGESGPAPGRCTRTGRGSCATSARPRVCRTSSNSKGPGQRSPSTRMAASSAPSPTSRRSSPRARVHGADRQEGRRPPPRWRRAQRIPGRRGMTDRPKRKSIPDRVKLQVVLQQDGRCPPAASASALSTP